MTELELSIIDDSATDRNSEPQVLLRKLLDEFEAQSGVHVRLTAHSWGNAWSELVKVALYGHGPDISEIGSTWVGSFVGMNELYPYSSEDIESLGGAVAFVPGLWQSGSLAGDNQVWAIPWTGSTRVIFYRRDILNRAGVDGETAFQSHENLVDSLEKLSAAGHTHPWQVPTQRTQNTLHFMTAWVWGAGGDFLSPDGRRCVFNQPNAVKGMSQYFGLERFLPRSSTGMSDVAAEAMFSEGLAAVTVAGQWMLWVQEHYAVPQVAENVGVALIPGIPFAGGSHLAMWRHSPHKSAALELIRFLTSRRVQIDYSQATGQLPTRLDLLEDRSFSDNPLYETVLDGLQSGRSLPSITLWGLVEDKLADASARIWSDLLDGVDVNVEQVIHRHLDPLAERLNLTLGSP